MKTVTLRKYIGITILSVTFIRSTPAICQDEEKVFIQTPGGYAEIAGGEHAMQLRAYRDLIDRQERELSRLHSREHELQIKNIEMLFKIKNLQNNCEHWKFMATMLALATIASLFTAFYFFNK